MIDVLKQFHKALIATMIAYRQKSNSGDGDVQKLVDELMVVTAERDLLLAEQEEALKMIDAMTEDLDKQ